VPKPARKSDAQADVLMGSATLGRELDVDSWLVLSIDGARDLGADEDDWLARGAKLVWYVRGVACPKLGVWLDVCVGWD
jgi:hypothetical protein